MALRNIRPLHVMWQNGISLDMLKGVFSGIENVLSLAGVLKELPYHRMFQRQLPGWFGLDGKPKPHQSLNWYIQTARESSKLADHLNARAILDELEANPNYAILPRYELVIVKEPMHWHDESERVVGGIGREGKGSVITLADFADLLLPVAGESDEAKKERVGDYHLLVSKRTEHELGHVLGLFTGISVPNDATDDQLKASHCQNACVMWWKTNLDLFKKIKDDPFCPSCLAKLKQYFIAP